MESSGKAAEAMLDQAIRQLQDGSFENAIKGFTACLLVSPDHAAAFRGRATARFQLKDWTGAAADFLRAKELNPDDPENWLGYGMSLALQLQIYPAIGVLDSLIARWPTFVRGHIQLGLLHIKLGAITKGKRALEEALKHEPNLQERRLIETTLNEQSKLDKGRYYRPDFEDLHRKKPNS
ncbi:MAG TPA: tetratricopeptide repeat protein [Elusimicrobiota bacterium]|nr:tetratricopeptide repeat protein [Elusimicrobiota bacterium]